MLIISVRLRLHLIEDNISLLCIFVATTLLLHQHSWCSHWWLHHQPLPWKETKIFPKCFVSSSLDRYLGNFDRKLNKKRQVQFYNGNVAPLKFLINIIKTSWTVECWPFPPCWPVCAWWPPAPLSSQHVALLILMNSTAQYSPLIMEPSIFLPPRKPSSSPACSTFTCWEKPPVRLVMLPNTRELNMIFSCKIKYKNSPSFWHFCQFFRGIKIKIWSDLWPSQRWFCCQKPARMRRRKIN